MKKLLGKIKHILDYIKKTVKNLKNPYWKAKGNYIKYYERLPIQENVILFESQKGTQNSGNIFYLMKYISLSEKYRNFKLYLSAWGRYRNKFTKLLNGYGIKNINIVTYSSDEYVRLLAGAKYLINDVALPPYYIKKKGQVYLNTWHGTPLKTLGRKIQNSDIAIGNAQKNFLVSDYLLYPNEYTRDIMLRDYMVENLSSNYYVMGGYPRNEIFFDDEARQKVRDEMKLNDKRVYAYMPTWRGTLGQVGSNKERTYLLFFFSELDKKLTDDEVLYINLHPVAIHANDNVAIKGLKHIRQFPEKYETYDFLNIADVLITDYSSVFFDFACTRKKIVLFPYDKEEYLKDRGMYFDMNKLPFPQATDIDSLLKELRTVKNYDDSEFLKVFNAYDNINASRQISDFVILGEDTGLKAEKVPCNGKENVLIYGGGLEKNGITAALANLLNIIDTDKRNYYITFYQDWVKKNASQLSLFNESIYFFAMSRTSSLTVRDKIIKKLYKKKLLSAKKYMKLMKTRVSQEFMRTYGDIPFNCAIHFTGYGDESIMNYSLFPKNNAIFVHSDMVREIKTKSAQRTDALRYGYNNFDKVAAVSESIVPSTAQISKKSDNIIVVHNLINYKAILEKGEKDIELDSTTKCSVERNAFYDIMKSDTFKFINVGRFSPEKGHDRLVNAFAKFLSEGNDAYLIIMGGNSKNNGYENLISKVNEMGLSDKVILLLSVSNPYPIIKACDSFILSSFYEGFGLVLVEADILGLPVISTDIVGPKDFMEQNGGTLVENSENGIYQGMKLLHDGKVKLLTADYEKYNKQCIDEFEKIFIARDIITGDLS